MPTLASLAMAILPWMLTPAPGMPEASSGALATQGDSTLLFRYAGFSSTIREARRLMNQHQFAESRRHLQPCLAAIPEHAEAHYLLAQMAYEERRFEACLTHLQTAERQFLKLDQLRRAELEAAEARDAALEAALQTSLASLDAAGVDPKGCSGGLYTTKAHALHDQQNQRLGHADEVQAEGLPAEFHLLQGNCLYRLKRLDEAKAAYQLAIEKDPSGPHAWNNLIGLYLGSGDIAQARQWLSRATDAHVILRPELIKAVQEKTSLVP